MWGGPQGTAPQVELSLRRVRPGNVALSPNARSCRDVSSLVLAPIRQLTIRFPLLQDCTVDFVIHKFAETQSGRGPKFLQYGFRAQKKDLFKLIRLRIYKRDIATRQDLARTLDVATEAVMGSRRGHRIVKMWGNKV